MVVHMDFNIPLFWDEANLLLFYFVQICLSYHT
jgi:hypothetical protein